MRRIRVARDSSSPSGKATNITVDRIHVNNKFKKSAFFTKKYVHPHSSRFNFLRVRFFLYSIFQVMANLFLFYF